MAFDPVTWLTMSVAALAALGALALHASRGDPALRPLRRTGAGVLGLGAGFALLLAAPADAHAPVRAVGSAALVLSHGLLWAGARRFGRRPAPFEIVAAGALLWLLAAALIDPSQAWRIGLTSAAAAAYSFAAAAEHGRGADAAPARRASRAFAAHGAFFALRAVLGPTLGFEPWGPAVAPFWGALLALETLVLAAVVVDASVARACAGAMPEHGHEPPEDPLTGVGTRRTLDRSGGALLGACRGAGRPACLLLMALDGLGPLADRHGRPAGDRLLVAFARLAHDYLPPTSLVCRIDGDAFAALLPGADLGRARAVADEIRALFAHIVLDDPLGPLRATVSIGVSSDAGERGPAAPGDLAGLLGRAARCLRAAGQGGGDRVVAEGDPGATPRAAADRTAA